jgi:hypothetical protein
VTRIQEKEKKIAKLEKRLNDWEKKKLQTGHWDTGRLEYIRREMNYIRDEIRIEQSLLYRLKDKDPV